MSRGTSGVTIAAVMGREAIDSRGNPTVEAEVRLSDGATAVALVPSGASTGSHEALELRDRDATRFNGSGVLTAVSNVNQTIGPWLIGRSPLEQAAIDEGLVELDGTPDKSRGEEVSLPVPMFNILNGGRHASDSADVQEFMVLPVGVSSFSEALRAGVEIYQSLRSLLRSGGHNLNVGDEGGFAPSLPSNKDALELVLRAVESAGYTPGRDVYLGLDVAATELFDERQHKYVLAREGATLDSGQLIDLYESWARLYPIISIEDGLFEDDWNGWVEMRRRLGTSVQLVGDDLLVTNIARIRRSIDEGASNAVLLKPNQIGTLTETHAALNVARDAGWGAVMSHRSGETEDTTIADLAVGWNVGQIKTGAPARSERVAKYNRLLRIEAELGDGAVYAGASAFEYLGRG